MESFNHQTVVYIKAILLATSWLYLSMMNGNNEHKIYALGMVEYEYLFGNYRIAQL